MMKPINSDTTLHAMSALSRKVLSVLCILFPLLDANNAFAHGEQIVAFLNYSGLFAMFLLITLFLLRINKKYKWILLVIYLSVMLLLLLIPSTQLLPETNPLTVFAQRLIWDYPRLSSLFLNLIGVGVCYLAYLFIKKLDRRNIDQ